MEGIVMHGTTILCVRHHEKVVMAGDGQVSLGNTIVKHTARKLRRLAQGRVLAGFAGSTADGLTLCEKLEKKLDEYNNNLRRAAVELARDWRADRILRRLEALMAVADRDSLLLLSGNGDVIEPDDGLIAIGSGGNFALAAARVLVKHSTLDARTIALEALHTAADICVFTNNQIVVEEL
jgi:ATP-dependent HslUV protease subunit HslV